MRNCKRLAESIEQHASTLRGMSLRILSQRDVPHMAGFTCSFIRYQATQAFRIAEWLSKEHVDDVDLIAHATRGLFESSLTYAHLIKGGGTNFLERMMSECAADHFDTMKAMKAICGGSTLDADFEEQLRHYEKLKTQKKINKTPPVRILADEVGLLGEYETMYSYYSKYTHPTLYHLVGDHREVYSVEACLIFGERAVQYLEMIIVDSKQILDIVLEQNNGKF